MTIRDILCGGGGAIIILLTLIQISPIKIDPWSWLAGVIGNSISNCINRDVLKKIDGLNTKIDDMDHSLSNMDSKVDLLDGKVRELDNKLDNIEKNVRELDNKINLVDKKVDESDRKNEEENVIRCRVRILRFGDEILHSKKHSKDHFDQILLDCTRYEHYCNEHTKFLNNITEQTISLIKDTYNKCMQEHSFL